MRKITVQKLTPQQQSSLLSGDEQIDTIRALVNLFDDQGAVIGEAGPAVNKAYEVLSHAMLLHPEREAMAKLLWHRFGDSSVEEWKDETHKAEFLEAADDVIFRARVRSGAPPMTDLNYKEYVRLAEQRISQQAGILAAKNSELQNLRSLLADRNEEIGRLNLLLNESKAFHGAECPDYPNCKGGCGLGCTHELEARKPSPPPSCGEG